MRKSYILDTNILIEDHKCMENLKNGEENWIYLPYTVLEELDSLKDKKPHLRNRIFDIVNELNILKDNVNILYDEGYEVYDNKDNKIINEIKSNISELEQPVFITNDKLFQFKAYKNNIPIEEYKNSNPLKQESEEYTGFINIMEEDKINNCFFWNEKGQIEFYSSEGSHTVYYENIPWKIKPRDHYQNCFLDLLDNENIDLVTVQSQPGKGKTFLSLASALYQTFEKKRYDKIYIVKSNYEIGNTLGYLPGSVSEKTMPYFKPILNFIEKLHKKRSLPDKVFDRDNEFQFNTNKIEFVPINYMRGVDIENSFVIIDEIQNLSRSDARSLLSRMGSNTKCICTGDIHQIDNPYLDSNNNAMNWIVKLFKGQKNYAHIVLKGKQTRGAICKMVIDCKL